MNFPSTQWSLILASVDCDAARQAWSDLANRYRVPIHAYFRVRYGSDRADDLTNAFFLQSMEQGWWARADIEQGSFRTYLKMLLRRFGVRHVDAFSPNAHCSEDMAQFADSGDEPDLAYDREFAHAMVSSALARLRTESVQDAGNAALWPYLLDRGDQGDLKQLAIELGLAHNTLLQRLRRLRNRLRQLLRDEIAHLVTDPEQVDEEVKSIQQSVRPR